jgi:hypothetical protein
MSASLHVPKAIKAKTTDALIEAILRVQDQESGKVSIINIMQDLVTKEWVCWYYPIRSLGGGVM